MKKSLVLVSILVLFLKTTSLAYAEIKNQVNVNSNTDGGDSKTSIKINNQVNTDSTSVDKSETNISVKQSEGSTSNVEINGQKYNLKGAGELNVKQNSKSDFTSPTPGKSVEETSPTPTAVATPSPISLPMAILSQSVSQMLTQIKNSLKKFFDNIF